MSDGVKVRPLVSSRKKNFFARLLEDMRFNWILYVLILPVFVSVSYTHLDVYKRQHIERKFQT